MMNKNHLIITWTFPKFPTIQKSAFIINLWLDNLYNFDYYVFY